MNKIVNLLREGVNYNKADIDRLLLGVDTDYVFETVDAMNDYLLDVTPVNGQACFVLVDADNGDQVSIYIYNTALTAWILYGDFSLFDMNARAIQIEADLADRSYSSTWYSGLAISGKTAGIVVLISLTSPETSLNDYYLNTTTGDVYKCVEMSLDGINAVWDWQLDISGAMYWVSDVVSESIVHTLSDNEDKTFMLDGINDVELTIPLVTHGFYAGVNFKSGAAPTAVSFINESGLTLKKTKFGFGIVNYTPTANVMVIMMFWCDGKYLYCAIHEVA